jgi:copper chaperone CopZ
MSQQCQGRPVQKTACIDYDPAKLTMQDFKQAVEAAGYRVE